MRPPLLLSDNALRVVLHDALRLTPQDRPRFIRSVINCMGDQPSACTARLIQVAALRTMKRIETTSRGGDAERDQ
jgi:hypothetical protein